ncbi:hypothetical protein MHYP_G00311110 [Metynnis hypsauchen]
MALARVTASEALLHIQESLALESEEDFSLSDESGEDSEEERLYFEKRIDPKEDSCNSSVGSQTYSLMRNLLSPAKPGEKSYIELVELLKAHYNPKPSEIVQRFKFNSRNRKPKESVSEYVAVLRELAQHCNYGDKLTEMLRDRLVCGIEDDRMQRRLLAEPELTYDKALKLAQAIETASKDIQDIQGQSKSHSGMDDKRQMGVHKFFVGPKTRDRNHSSTICYRCGGVHLATECRFIKEKCHKCKKVGHIQKMCRARLPDDHSKPTGGGKKKYEKRENKQSAHHIRETQNSDNEFEEIFTMHNLTEPNIPKVEPIQLQLKVNDLDVNFEVDTGCSVTILTQAEYSKLECKGKTSGLDKSSVNLKTYTGERVETLGVAKVNVVYKDIVKQLPVVVVSGKGPNLLGRGWIRELAVNWCTLNQISETAQTLQEVLGQHDMVFKESLGTWKGPPAKIHVDKEAVPRFFKPRPVPYAMKQKVEAELDRLVQENILQPVKFSEWAAPIVPVLKPDNSVRICGDYKLTVNRVSKLEQYPIPRIEDLFEKLAGGKKFTKLDLSHAYQQVTLDEESKQYVTISTHKGLFTMNRLPFGVSSSPAIFQRIMEGLLQGIPSVAVYLDDILVTGRNDQEHLKTLSEVLKRLEEAGLRLKRSKCSFMGKEAEFLGHKVDSTGLHPLQNKVSAIQKAPSPTNVTELKAYLGLLNYYNRFLPNLSTLLAPLHQLLRKDSKWNWQKEQEAAFEKSKKLIQSSDVLVHYDSQKDLILSCDASPYGVGAVLSHRMPNGEERPISFMSRTLTPSERNYSQLDKEGLAVMFGVQRFHKYLYGRKFIICTDHKPLLSLFNEMKAVPQMVSPRIQRWAVALRAYEYVIVYKPGKTMVTLML